MKNPYLSVIIPAYNEEQCLIPLFHSLYWQSLDKSLFEVILVDNNSTDNTYKIAKRCKKLFSELKITILNEKIQGVCFARNTGGEKAKGNTLVFFDADNVASDTLLEKIYYLSKVKKYSAGTIRALPIENSLVGYFIYWLLELIKCTLGKPFGKSFCDKNVFLAISGYNTEHDKQLWYLGTNLDFLVRVKKFLYQTKRKPLTHITIPIHTSLRRLESKRYFPILLRWGMVYMGIPILCRRILDFLSYSRS